MVCRSQNNKASDTMSTIHPVIPAAAARARVNADQYRELYRQSVEDNEGFWATQARRINWIKPFSRRVRQHQASVAAGCHVTTE